MSPCGPSASNAVANKAILCCLTDDAVMICELMCRAVIPNFFFHRCGQDEISLSILSVCEGYANIMYSPCTYIDIACAHVNPHCHTYSLLSSCIHGPQAYPVQLVLLLLV